MSKRGLDIHEIRETSKRLKTAKDISAGVDDFARVQSSFSRMVQLLEAGSHDYYILRKSMTKMTSSTVTEFLDEAINGPFQDVMSTFAAAMKHLKVSGAALRVEIQNLSSMKVEMIDAEELTESESDTEEEVFGAELQHYNARNDERILQHNEAKLELFRHVKEIVGANEDIFADFLRKVNGMNVLTITSVQLRQLESSLDKVNDTLALCDDFFKDGYMHSWVRFSSAFERKLQKLEERVETFTDQVAEPIKAMEDTITLATTLKTTLGIKRRACALCLDDKFAIYTCSDCRDANVCGECYSQHVLRAAEGGLRAMKKVLTFSCVMAPRSQCSGVYDEELMQKVMTVEAMRALRAFNVQVVNEEEALAKKRDIRRQIADMTPMERIYEDEFKRLGDKIGNFCPNCLTPFADFVGCAAVTCGSCEQKFCALCLDPCPDHMEEHEHVRQCRLKDFYDPDDGEGVFVSLANWKQGRARILNKELVDYVNSLPFDGVLPDGLMLKQKLVDTFANPDAPVPALERAPVARRPLPVPLNRPTAAPRGAGR